MPVGEPSNSWEQLQARMEAVPRLDLDAGSTPLHECATLTEDLQGPRVLIKRDDLTGRAFGGNKIRKLEYILQGVKERGADTIVVGAARQSNFCREISGCASKLGIEVVAYLRGTEPLSYEGNVLLDHIFGAKIFASDAQSWSELHREMYGAADVLSAQGRQVEVVTGFEPLGSLAYVNCAMEVSQQCASLGLEPTHVYLSSGTGTQAGLQVGFAALGMDVDVVGVGPMQHLEGYDSIPHRLSEVANWISAKLELSLNFAPENFQHTTAHVDGGYAHCGYETAEAIRTFGRREAILLDPVYTGKAMAALLAHSRQGRLGGSDTVVFLHTGGTPAMFASIEGARTNLGLEGSHLGAASMGSR
jgi:1-aminocyclopropane-1-carboxylate deaminase/D-cysteine desulfhydrase-like pyridoxal-dependent ACC family enzyme